MANTNPSPNEILTALRDYGVDVKTYSGGGRSWDTVGRAWNSNGGGLFGAVVHHTASRATGYSGAPSLIWAQQYPGYPACNLLVGRGKGDTYLLSAGSCYHSGLGGPWPDIGINSAGNVGHFRLWGIEIEASVAYGSIPESVPYITDYQVENTAKTCAALWDLCGWPNKNRIVTHGDWTDSGPYLGHSSYGPYRGRKGDTRRSTHPGSFWQKKSEEYKEGGGGSSPDPGEGNDDDPKDPKNVVNLARTIGKNSVALSDVAGTPQTARFAALNMSNEPVFLSEGSASVINAGDGIFWVKARTIVEGDENEITVSLDKDKSATGELIIETTWVQDKFIGEAAAAFIADAFESKYRSINAKIFGNPLIQIGDIAKFKYKTGKIEFPETKYYYVSKVSQSFQDGGLETNVRLSPVP